MDSIRLTSLIVAPLWARDRLLGTLCFGRVDFDEEYDGALLGWAREIAGRCASALDTAQLVRDLRDTLEWRKSLMAMISHDLRNPLSAIELSVRSLAPQTPHKERRSSRKQVDVIQRSATYMNHLLNDLQATSLLEAGAFHLELRHEHGFELAEEACQLAEPLLAARSLHLEREFARDLPDVFADREAVQRVFSNLLGNAAKFTPPGGCIRVTARTSGHVITFGVCDSGPGIPDEQRRHVFERYWMGRKGAVGLGLGLYISRCIVEAHGGRIWIESSSDAGTTFLFELRCCAASN